MPALATEHLQRVLVASTEQIGDLLDDLNRVADAAGPEGVPNPVDLALQVTDDHASQGSPRTTTGRRVPASAAVRGCSDAQGQRIGAGVLVHDDRVAIADGATEDFAGQAVANLLLHQAAQRAGAICRVIASLGEPGPGGVGHLQGDAAITQAGGQLANLQFDDMAELLLA